MSSIQTTEEVVGETQNVASRALQGQSIAAEKQLLGTKRQNQSSKQTEDRLMGLKVESEH